ncbi:hypothetical protein [Enterococcus sp. 5H]|uniref:hypothetical protein n=1 Tax=Enterococcus sp. 5H TaxID=1229490 RepID=UPI0023048826|nr:hypothetical protein [Enterococcus sp. 5H]MDA9472283.1 hypothetical protein [Enterococcus sp. 5H]
MSENRDINELILTANSICDALEGIEYLVDNTPFENSMNIIGSIVRSVKSLANSHANDLENISLNRSSSIFETKDGETNE